MPRVQDASLPARTPMAIVRYLTQAPFLRVEAQRQAGLKAAAGGRFDYAAFAHIGLGGTTAGADVTDRGKGTRWLQDLAAQVDATRGRNAPRSARPGTSGSLRPSSSRPSSNQQSRPRDSSSLAQPQSPRAALEAAAELQRQHDHSLFVHIWRAAGGAETESKWLKWGAETNAASVGFSAGYVSTVCARDKRSVVVLRPPPRELAPSARTSETEAGEDETDAGETSDAASVALSQQLGAAERRLPLSVQVGLLAARAAEPARPVSVHRTPLHPPPPPQIELALDRCHGDWEAVAAELVAFEPNHRARIRAIKAAAERRAGNEAALVERQRRRLSIEAKVEAALLDEGYPVTPRSDRDAHRPSPTASEDANASAAGERTARTGRGRRGSLGGEPSADDPSRVRVAPLPVSGALLSFDAARIAVDSEPTLLWTSIDAAAGAAAADAAGPALGAKEPVRTAAAHGTWGADGYSAFSWQGAQDPLRGPMGRARSDTLSRGGGGGGGAADAAPTGEEAPLRDVVFRLFNDAVEASLADAEAQRRRAAGEASLKDGGGWLIGTGNARHSLPPPLRCSGGGGQEGGRRSADQRHRERPPLEAARALHARRPALRTAMGSVPGPCLRGDVRARSRCRPAAAAASRSNRHHARHIEQHFRASAGAVCPAPTVTVGRQHQPHRPLNWRAPGRRRLWAAERGSPALTRGSHCG